MFWLKIYKLLIFNNNMVNPRFIARFAAIGSFVFAGIIFISSYFRADSQLLIVWCESFLGVAIVCFIISLLVPEHA